jgi:hypothetical protein
MLREPFASAFNVAEALDSATKQAFDPVPNSLPHFSEAVCRLHLTFDAAHVLKGLALHAASPAPGNSPFGQADELVLHQDAALAPLEMLNCVDDLLRQLASAVKAGCCSSEL